MLTRPPSDPMTELDEARRPSITAPELRRALGAAAGTVAGLSPPESDLDAVHLDVVARCFRASVDEVGRPVRQ